VIKKFILISLSVALFFVSTSAQASPSYERPLKATKTECKTFVKKIMPTFQKALGAPGMTDSNQAKIHSDNFLALSKLFAKYRSKTKGQLRSLYKDATIQSREISDIYFGAHLQNYVGNKTEAGLKIISIIPVLQELTFTTEDILAECP
jgi:hypothetical protein